MLPLKPYEQAAIDKLIAKGIFTKYTVDEEGEVDAAVKLRTLAVFLVRINSKIDVLEAKVANLEAAPAGKVTVEVYVDGEPVI